MAFGYVVTNQPPCKGRDANRWSADAAGVGAGERRAVAGGEGGAVKPEP